MRGGVVYGIWEVEASV